MRLETKIIVFDIGIAVFGAVGMILNRRLKHQHDEVPAPSPLSVRQAVLGALSAVASTYVSDHDVGGVRRSRKRSVLFMLGWNFIVRKLEPETSWSFGFGGALGLLVYRIWFGIARPIPEPRVNYSEFLRRRR
jgi:hypothetical protein